jgi:hypothetical protein
MWDWLGVGGMTTVEVLMVVGLVVNTLGLGTVLFKLIWGHGANQQLQYNTMTREFFERNSRLKDEWADRFDTHQSAFQGVVQNLNDRIHQIELAAMEFRATSAETYMRRDSYHRATEEFKRDVQVAHNDLKKDMHGGFQKLEAQMDDIAKTVNQIVAEGHIRRSVRPQTG